MPDESLALATRKLADEQKQQRQKSYDDELAYKTALAEAGAVAGVATSTVPADALVAPPTTAGVPGGEYVTEHGHATAAVAALTLGTPRGGPVGENTPRGFDGETPREMPSTVGMSRQAALEARRAWRMQQQGAEASLLTPAGQPAGGTAGMSSHYASRTVRGQVAPLDPASAADYNLSRKLISAQSTPRAGGAAQVYPLGGAAAEALTATGGAGAPFADVSNVASSNAPFATSQPTACAVGGGAPPSGISTLSHADRLKRMRELRQSAMATPIS